MTVHDSGVQDIFKGSDRIEIFGKIPSLLWAYIDTGRQLVGDLDASPDRRAEGISKLSRILDILNSAADHLGNAELKERLDPHIKMLAGLTTGTTSDESFARSFSSSLAALEQVAGHRTPLQPTTTLSPDLFERELEKIEKIKTGRSADIVVNVDIINEVRSFLAKEVMTEGISSLLVIDNAGSLIVNVGNKIELDAVSLAAVAAANFAATEQIARLIGERDFVLLFYKGHSESFHFMRVGEEYIIVTIFNNSLSLGLVRLRIAEVAAILEKKLPMREV